MAKYIDADKIEYTSYPLDGGYVDTVFVTKEEIDRQPTADVVEVRHGKWMPYYEEVEVYNSGGFTEMKRTGWICGRCKRKRSFTPYGTEKYCCECGAKMDLKEGVR